MDYSTMSKHKIISFSELHNGEIFTFNENYKEGLYGFKEGYPYLFLERGAVLEDSYIYALRTNILIPVSFKIKHSLKVRKLKYELKISE